MLCFRKVPVAKKSMDKRGGYQDLPSKFFLYHNAQKLSQGNPSLLCFSKLPAAKKLTD